VQVGLGGGEEIEHVDLVVGGTDPVDATHPLEHAGRVPGEVVVDDDVGAVEVDPLRQDVGGDEDADAILSSLFPVRIEVVLDEVARRRRPEFHAVVETSRAAEEHCLAGKFPLQPAVEVLACLLRFGEDQELLALENGVAPQIGDELLDLGIAGDPHPDSLDLLQEIQVIVQPGEEIVGEFVCRIFLHPVLFHQIEQGLLVVLLQEVVHIYPLADVDLALFDHGNELLIGRDETLERVAEGVEAALQALDQDAFHESADVALRL